MYFHHHLHSLIKYTKCCQ